MTSDRASLSELWQIALGVPEPPAVVLTCPIATRFEQKLQQLLFAPLEQQAPTGISRDQINQAKFLLQEEWHAWRRTTPSAHYPTKSGEHRCLLQVYDEAYERLQLLSLSLFPDVNLIGDYAAITKTREAAHVVEMTEQQAAREIRGIFIGEPDE